MDTITKDEAVQQLVDDFLKDISHLTLVKQSQVVDFLLDLRRLHGTPNMS